MNPLSIALVFAHPDDETFMMGATVRKLTELGHNVSLYTATSGDAGKFGRLPLTSRDQLAAKRRKELQNACHILGVKSLVIGPFADKGLSGLGHGVLQDAVADFLRTVNAQIVFTFPADGFSGHPDHTAISAAVFAAVPDTPCVRKLYVGASPVITQTHMVTTVIDVAPQRQAKLDALLAHETQVFSVERVYPDLSSRKTDCLSSTESFVLAWHDGIWWPSVSPVETDLHE